MVNECKWTMNYMDPMGYEAQLEIDVKLHKLINNF